MRLKKWCPLPNKKNTIFKNGVSSRLPAANRPSKDIFCRLQAVSCCHFLKTLDLTLGAQDADFFVNHQDDMKPFLGVGNPNLDPGPFVTLDPNQKRRFFAAGEASSQGELMARGPGERQERAMVSQGVCSGGRDKKVQTKRPCRLVVSGGFKGLLGILLTPKKRVQV